MRSVSPYSCQAFWKAGISARQGGHQLAQKFRITGFPRRSESLILESSIDNKLKSGAKKFSLGASMAEEGSADGGMRETHIQANRTRGMANADKENFIFM